MADEQYTDAQLNDGTTLRFQGQLSPEQVRAKVQAYRLKTSNPDQYKIPSNVGPNIGPARTDANPAAALSKLAFRAQQAIRENVGATTPTPNLPAGAMQGAMNPSPANFMASLPIGVSQMIQGVAQQGVPGQKMQGAGNFASGTLNAATIPSLITGSGAVESAINKVPSATRAIEGFKDVNATVGQHTIATTDRLVDALNRVKQLSQSLSMPKAANGLMDRLANLDLPPLTFSEARDFYTTLGNKLSAEEKMAGVGRDARMNQAIGKLRDALRETINDTAESGGKLEKLQSSINEFRQSKSLEGAKNRLKELGSYAAKGAAQAGGAGAAYELYRMLKK